MEEARNRSDEDLENRFIDITGCDKGRARVVLGATGWDLQTALNLYWDRDEGEMVVINHESNSVEQEKSKQVSSIQKINPDDKHNPDNGQSTPAKEDKELEAVIEASLADHRSKEPSVDTMFKVLCSNYSQKDPETMKKLCLEFEGKSAELEKYLEENFDKIPTKQQAANRKLKSKLEDEVSMLQEAGVEGLEVESCPSCWAARIIEDQETTVFCCTSSDCGLEHCRKCWMVQHEPEPCTKVRKGDAIKTDTPKTANIDFEVKNILPKRQFDENDPLEIEYRRAEGQFLRMQAKDINIGLSIQSIDVVTNRQLEERFQAKKKELEKKGFTDCLLLFHGTPQKNVESILKNNLTPP